MCYNIAARQSPTLQEALKHVGLVNVFESYAGYIGRMDQRALSEKFNQDPEPATFPVWEKAMNLRVELGGFGAVVRDGIAALRR